jgi:DNA anti-recombination protein RmuC
MRNTTTLILALGIIAAAGCKPTSDKVPQAQNTPAPRVDSSAASTNDRTTAQEKLSAQLKALDAKMADLKARAQSAGQQAKTEWEQRRPQLEAQRESAAKKLDELKQASKETWDETRTKTEAAFSELEKGFKEAWAKLKE